METDFRPIGAFVQAHEATADRAARVAVLGSDGCTHLPLRLHRAQEYQAADEKYTLLLVKTALWLRGGYALLTEDEAVFRWLQRAYGPGGVRAFDRDFMSGIYGEPFRVELRQSLPPEQTASHPVTACAAGCRIGIDLGGSDRKAAAVIDGETVYTEEVLWQPKTAADLRYHYENITAALRSAAAHLPRVDAVGFSTAGVVLDGQVRRSSLFMGVPAAEFDRHGRDILRRAARDVLGDVPCTVCNDGDVAALAGSVTLGRRSLLGIAMGTSQAGGYVGVDGQISGWLNELAFLPVDLHPAAPVDPWSGDRGVGERYFSQEGVLRLAVQRGLAPVGDTPAQRLRWIQDRAEAGDDRALDAFFTLGRMLGQTLPWYRRLLGCENVLLLGRVVDGAGGERLAEACRAELAASGEQVELFLPEESFRRVGQASAAALLNTAIL